jgi:ubiquinone/menaquinone biosynthesis C-methylase UbiE
MESISVTPSGYYVMFGMQQVIPRRTDIPSITQYWEQQASLQEDNGLPAAFASSAELLQDGARVLVIGSGAGYLALAAWHLVAPTGAVTGIDISNAMVTKV